MEITLYFYQGSSLVKIAVSDDQDESEQVGQSKTLKSIRQGKNLYHEWIHGSHGGYGGMVLGNYSLA